VVGVGEDLADDPPVVSPNQMSSAAMPAMETQMSRRMSSRSSVRCSSIGAEYTTPSVRPRLMMEAIWIWSSSRST
jgi:hypothetical protein